MSLNPAAAQALAPYLPARAVNFCNQCGKVFGKSHADCRSHVPAQFAAPRCPAGQTEHWYTAGAGVQLVCHLEIEPGWPETEIDPAEPASATLCAAYLNGVDVLGCLLSSGHIALIEEEALIEVRG